MDNRLSHRDSVLRSIMRIDLDTGYISSSNHQFDRLLPITANAPL